MSEDIASRLPRWPERLGLVAIVGAAAVLLFWNLGERYLWQDEANTAVLAVRLLEFGKPLTYDGTNFVSPDDFAAEDKQTIGLRTKRAEDSVAYHVDRGALKEDAAWIYQPWGQFVVAAAGIGLLGPTTLAARLPFALAALATVIALYALARRASGSVAMASIACVLLVSNVYWILHARQSRYYALSGLLLVLTLLAHQRWQRGERHGAALFVLAAWCWFQVDYGTVWPVLLVLFGDALGHGSLRGWRGLREPLGVGAALLVALAPFAVYYELWERRSVQLGTWGGRFEGAVFNINLYVVPLIVVVAGVGFAWWTRRSIAPSERRLLVVSLAAVATTALWVPSVAPAVFFRYLVALAPLGALITAWLLVRCLGAWDMRLCWVAVVALVSTTFVADAARPVLPDAKWRSHSVGVRGELGRLAEEIFGQSKDPNRIVIDWLRENAAPDDEILINYEDLPLVYYLPNPIRGGIAAFRVEDESSVPAFVVLRRSVRFSHWPVFERALRGHEWEMVRIGAPDVRWGNNPDPMVRRARGAVPEIYVARRVEP